MALIIDADHSASKEGVWAPFEGSEFRIASSDSLRFQRTLQRLQAPYRKKLDKGTLDPGESRRILCQAMAGTLLLDWRNVKDSTGEDVEFTDEAATKALINIPSLREFVQEFALNGENFRAEVVEYEGKSSVTS